MVSASQWRLVYIGEANNGGVGVSWPWLLFGFDGFPPWSLALGFIRLTLNIARVAKLAFASLSVG